MTNNGDGGRGARVTCQGSIGMCDWRRGVRNVLRKFFGNSIYDARIGLGVFHFRVLLFISGFAFVFPPRQPFVDGGEASVFRTVGVVGFVVAGEADESCDVVVGHAELDAASGGSSEAVEVTLVEVRDQERDGQ